MKNTATQQNEKTRDAYTKKLLEKNKKSLERSITKRFRITKEATPYALKLRQGDTILTQVGYDNSLTATNAFNGSGKIARSMRLMAEDAYACGLSCKVKVEAPIRAELLEGTKVLSHKTLK